LITIKDLIGHSTVKITERYTHPYREQKRRAVELLAKKPQSKAKNQEDLLRHSDTEEDREKTPRTIPLFSIN
jgi:hypothetical protein